MALDSIDYQQIKMALKDCLREEGVTGETFLNPRWSGGRIVIYPRDPDLAPKEIPVDDLFHKVVMVRDRLRVLESKINSNKSIAEREKVELQQYITRCYGSLTTFNVLFRDKADQFIGQRDGSVKRRARE
jgi:hypothetical protein